MRALVRSLLISDTGLSAAISADRWIQRGAVLETPPRPFAVIGYAGTFKSPTPIGKYRLEVWIHDERGDYTFIDTTLKRVKFVMKNSVGIRSSTAEITQVDWISDSPDLYDDGYRTGTRSAAFDVVGKEV